MEELTNFDLLGITTLNPKEFLLTVNLNGKKRDFTAYVEASEPIFGVNFSDDFIYVLRNYQSDIQQLIKIIEDHYHGKQKLFPIPLLIKEKATELRAA